MDFRDLYPTNELKELIEKGKALFIPGVTEHWHF
jgi:hypothetical protein